MNRAGWIALALLLWMTGAFAIAATRSGRGGAADRRSPVSGAGEAVVGLASGRELVPWDVVPPLVWAGAAAVAAWGLLAAGRSWPGLPAVSGGRKRVRLATAAGGVVLKAALVVALV